MSNQKQRRHLAGWIVAGAAATAIFTAGGAALSYTAVNTVASALSSASASHSSNQRAGYNPYTGSGNGSSNGSTTDPFGGSTGTDPFGGSNGGSNGDQSGQSGSGSTGPVATANEAKGVVLIDTVLQYQGAQAAGTGIVLTSNGEILTNNHVVEGSTSIKVTVASTGKSYTADVVGTDATDDVAVLKLEGASGLTTAPLDASGNVSVGDNVTAVGNAGGTGTLTSASGSITGTDKTITTQAEDAVASETLNGLIETDADIQAGDSGGPMFNSNGKIIGIDTAASSGSSTPDGYAIPIEDALSIAHQIDNGNASSTITIGLPAFLGVEVGADSSTGGSSDGSNGGLGDGSNGFGFGDGSGSSNSFGYSDGSGNGYSSSVAGAQISQVIDGTAAANAGLQAGDTITAVNGNAISSSSDLTTALSQFKPGQKVQITYTDGNGSSNNVTATLGSGPAA
ncbi:hypothetical protein GCM10027568_21400 [Humibacter soli]